MCLSSETSEYVKVIPLKISNVDFYVPLLPSALTAPL